MNDLKIYDEKNEVKEFRSYLPSPFIMACLPLRDVQKGVFTRKYNNISLYLTGAPKVPYGANARLLLSLFTTYCVLNKNNDSAVEIFYKSQKELLDELQLPKQRGKQIIEQIEYFSKSSFIYEEKVDKVVQKSLFDEYKYDKGNIKATINSFGNVPFIDIFQYIGIEDGKKKNGAAFRIVINEKFARLCKTHSVPINYTVYKELSSATSKDLYAWLIYRNNSLKDDETIFIPKEKIVEQFRPVSKDSADYNAGVNTNYAAIKEDILEIKNNYYQDLNVRFIEGGSGFELKKSPAIIESKDRRYVLISSLM